MRKPATFGFGWLAGMSLLGTLGWLLALSADGGGAAADAEAAPGTREDDVQCVPPPTPEPPPLNLPNSGSEPMRDLDGGERLWNFLQQEAFRQRGEGFRADWAFHMLAASKNLGMPLALSARSDQQIKFGAQSYGFQPFAGDVLFNVIPRWTEIQSLRELVGTSIPAAGLGFLVLDAAFTACGGTLHADQAFAQYVVREGLGPSLSEGFTITVDGGQYDVQIFGLDALYSPVGKYSEITRLSQAPSGALREAIWSEVYQRSAKSAYDPASKFQQAALEAGIGVPLTGVYRTNFEGHAVDVQVWTSDTLFAEPDGAVLRQSSLPKPAFSITETVTPDLPEPTDALADRTPLFNMLPVAGQPPIAQFYGYTRYSAGNGRSLYTQTQGRHSGVDFSVPVGTSLYAIDYGLVVWAGNNVSGTSFGAGPKSVIVRYGNIYALYGHTSVELVSPGQIVAPGQEIAKSGYPSAPHLHFELRPVPASTIANQDPRQKPVNPGYALNPIDYFSNDMLSYFTTQLEVLGGRRHFCQGDLNNQERIQFGGPLDNRACQ